MIKYIQIFFVLVGLLLCANETSSQRTMLRKDMKKQEARNESYSKRATLFYSLQQIGALVRLDDNEEFNTAKGLRAWQYGLGFGWIIPIAGPVYLRPEVDYRFRNYRMSKENIAIIGVASSVKRYRLASHAAEFGINLRFTNAKGGPIQRKYIDFGYIYGFNFANRIVYTQQTDPAIYYGATSIKAKLKNPDFFNVHSHYVQITMGKEGFSFFGQYRISDWFERSPNINFNRKLPEVSPLTLGITLLINRDHKGENTDEKDSPEN